MYPSFSSGLEEKNKLYKSCIVSMCVYACVCVCTCARVCENQCKANIVLKS